MGGGGGRESLEGRVTDGMGGRGGMGRQEYGMGGKGGSLIIDYIWRCDDGGCSGGGVEML